MRQQEPEEGTRSCTFVPSVALSARSGAKRSGSERGRGGGHRLLLMGMFLTIGQLATASVHASNPGLPICENLAPQATPYIHYLAPGYGVCYYTVVGLEWVYVEASQNAACDGADDGQLVGHRYSGVYSCRYPLRPATCRFYPHLCLTEAERELQSNSGKPEACEGNPCNPATGNKFQIESDYAGQVSLVRYYNSGQPLAVEPTLGPGWSHSYSGRIFASAASHSEELIDALRPDGRLDRFAYVRLGLYLSVDAPSLRLQQSETGWTIINPTGEREVYDATGRLVELRDRGGATTRISRDGSERVATVRGPFGHELQFSYDLDGRLAGVTDPAGRKIEYTHDSRENLAEVAYQDGTSRLYHYEDNRFPHHLTGITDENGDRYSTFRYDDIGRAVSSEHAGGYHRVNLVYDEGPDGSKTVVTDAGGDTRVYRFTSGPGRKRLKEFGHSSGHNNNRLYDARKRVVSMTDEHRQTQSFVYDDFHLISRTDAKGTPEERTTRYSYWSEDDDRLTSVVSAGVSGPATRRREIRYDQLGNPIEVTVSGFAPDGEFVSRTTRHRFNAYGQIIETDGPRTDLLDEWHFEYNECDVGAGCGQLRAVINPLGHTIAFDAYDAHGRLQRRTDQNGLQRNYSYDERGRLVRLVEGGLTGAKRERVFKYDKVGQLRAVSGTGTELAYEYDAAHQLTKVISTGEGYIEYRYNLKGNRIGEETYDTLGNLTRRVLYDYDEQGRLVSTDVGGVKTRQRYDDAGRKSSIIDASGFSTLYRFDPLGRQIGVADALQGLTTYDYDDSDRLVSVEDPREVETRYAYDDLDNLIIALSPDAGEVLYAYDSAGNRVSRTDARGIGSFYHYDALDRMVALKNASSDTGVLLEYDEGPFALGRLSRVVTQERTASFRYDQWGSVLEEQTTQGSEVHSVRYVYDELGRLSKLLYPSGVAVIYAYDEQSRVGALYLDAEGEERILVDSIGYMPFGPATSLRFGNGLRLSREFDEGYRLISQRTEKVEDISYERDAAGDVVQVKDGVDPGEEQVFGYDPLNRLVRAEGISGTREYDYDAVGNRISQSGDGFSADYLYAADRNQLLEVTATESMHFDYDRSGNTVRRGVEGLQYDEHNRLTEVSVGARVLARYGYNLRGERISKETSEGVTRYHYDVDGNLLAETDGRGESIREYVYLNGSVIALLRPRDTGTYAQHEFVQIDPGDDGVPLRVLIDTEEQSVTLQGKQRLRGRYGGKKGYWVQRGGQLRFLVWTQQGSALQGIFRLQGDVRRGKLRILRPSRRQRFLLSGIQRDGLIRGVERRTGKAVDFRLDETKGRLTVVQTPEPAVQYRIAVHKSKWGPEEGRRRVVFRGNEAGLSLRGVVQWDASGKVRGIVSMRERNGRWQEVKLIGEHHKNGLDGRSVYYAHTDYRNAPRILTDEDQSVAWRAEYTPFGTAIVTVNRVENNLRLPGQYFDSETALHYNYHRYYDPSTGRYITSDPIGLAGGLNTYVYANGDPVQHTDRFGLRAELCSRPFSPLFIVPYARHCYIRFDGSNRDTLSFDNKGVHPDSRPSWGTCVPMKGKQNDDCIRREMKKCRADQYDFTGFSCCHCPEEAMKACGVWIPVEDWPNWPVNPGPLQQPPGYAW